MDKLLASNEIFKIVRKTFSQFSKYRQRTLADLITAFFDNESFTLRNIASGMPGDANVNVKHKLKRLQNFLDGMELDDAFWKSYARTILSLPYLRLRRRPYVTIAIDFTPVNDDFSILAASISYQGRAIPIYLKMWADPKAPYDYWGRVKGFLKELRPLLPEQEYVLLFDRGFASQKLFSFLDEEGWADYVIRVNDTWKMRTEKGRTFYQLGLFDQGLHERVTLSRNNPYPGINMVVEQKEREEGGKSAWCLATSLDNEVKVVNEYERRMWIEEGFRDLKQHLKWEKYTRKIPWKERLERAITVSCLSYAIQVCLGSRIDVPPSEEQKTSVIKRFRHIMNSVHREADRMLSSFVRLFASYHYRFEKNLCYFYG